LNNDTVELSIGDVVMITTGYYQGSIGIVSNPSTTNQGVLVMLKNEQLMPEIFNFPIRATKSVLTKLDMDLDDVQFKLVYGMSKEGLMDD